MAIAQVGDYAEHSDAILLVIVPAAQAPEIASYRALRIAKEYDGEGKWLLKLIVLVPVIVLIQANFATWVISDTHFF